MKVLVSNSFDHFHSQDLSLFCTGIGYNDWTDYDARVDSRIIEWIETNINKLEEGVYGFSKDRCIKIENVNTDIPWLIYDYKGIEHIHYLKEHNKDLNWYY